MDVQNQVSRTESIDLIQSSPDDQPLSNAHLQSVLENIVSMNPLPFPWIIVSAKPVIICRTKVDPYKQAQIDFTIRADTNMKWTLFVKDCEFDWILCDLPTHLITMESILLIVQKLDSCNLYVWETRMRNLSSCTSKGQSLYMESQVSNRVVNVFVVNAMCP